MRNENGSALAFVLIIFAVLMILGTSVLSMSLSETNFVVQDVKKIKADYTARSGAEAMASYLIEHPDKIQDTIDKTAIQPASGSLNGISFELTVEGSGEQFKIISSAIDNGNVVSSVNLDMIGGKTNLMHFSVFSNEAPVIGKNHKGNVGTNANTFDILKDNQIDGNAQVVNASNLNALKNKANGTVTSVTNKVKIPPIDKGLFEDVLPNKEDHNIKPNEVEYYVSDYLGKKNNGSFTAIGGGTLHILVKEIGGNLDIYVKDGTRVIIYSEADEILMKGNPNLPVVLYAPNTTIKFSGGGNGGVTGQIICDDYEGPTSNAFNFVALNLGMDDLAISDNSVVIKRQKYSK